MKIAPETLDDRAGRFVEGLTAAGAKLTPQRLEIFREVAKSADHPDVDTAFRGVRKRLPTVSLDTVHRTPWSLIDLGLLSTVGHSRERVRFYANMGSHRHFVCEDCGVMWDFQSDEFDRVRIPDVVRKLGSAQKAQVEIRGTCTRCAGRTTSNRCAARRKEARWKRRS